MASLPARALTQVSCNAAPIPSSRKVEGLGCALPILHFVLQQRDIPFLHFMGPDFEPSQQMRAESLRQRNIRGIASSGHQDPPLSGCIVARIKHPPAGVEIDLHPSGKIRRGKWLGFADIA